MEVVEFPIPSVSTWGFGLRGSPMPTIYEFASRNRCSAFHLGELLKGWSGSSLAEFESLAKIETYFPSEILYEAGEESSRLLAVLEGRVKLCMDSSFDRRMTVRVARRGQLLGLTEVLSGSPFELTAEAMSKCSIALVHRNDFCRFLMRNPNAYGCLVHDIGQDYKCACERLRMLGLAPSVQIRLARLLLDWCGTGHETRHGIQLHLTLTQREIGEFIGVSRESVSRALRDLQQLRLLHLHGRNLMIPSRAALSRYVELPATIGANQQYPSRDLSANSGAVRSSTRILSTRVASA